MAKPRKRGGDRGSACASDRLALLLGPSAAYLLCQPGCGWQFLDGDVSRVDVHQFDHQFHESKLGVATSTIDFSLQQIMSNQMVSCSSYNYIDIDMNNFMLHFGSSPTAGSRPGTPTLATGGALSSASPMPRSTR